MAFWNRTTDSDDTATVTPASASRIGQLTTMEAGPFESFSALRRFQRELETQRHVHAVELVRMSRGYARFALQATGPVQTPATITVAEQGGLPTYRRTAVAA